MPDETKLLAAIDAYADQSYGSQVDGGELARQRALALDAYAGKNIEPAPEGRSQVVDWTVFETVQWILPSLTRIFAGGDDIVEFDPFGPEDEEAAQQESEYLNFLVTQKNNWFLTCLQFFQDALITKNAYCLVEMEEKLIPETERYEDQSEEQVALLLEEEGVEVVGQEVIYDEENAQPVIDPMSGQPMIDEFGQPMMQPVPRFNIEIKRVTPKSKLKFTVLPPENCRVGEDTPDFTLDDCNYFEYIETTTISDLRKQGYDVEDDISDEPRGDTREETARDDALYTRTTDFDTPDPTMRQVDASHIWIRHDYDEDGIAELQYVYKVGRTILDRYEVSRIPVASIVPFINTHRHVGNSVADLVFDIQRIKTSLLRGGLDSLNLSINPRHAVSDAVNLDDLLVSRPGGVVRLRKGAVPGEGHVLPLTTEFVFPQAQEGLRHMDTVVEGRVGVNRIFQGIDEGQLNDHNRIGQLSTMAAQRVEQIARIFANGIERLFSLAHELIVKSGHQQEAIKLRGEWVNIDPTQWKTGRDMRIVAPFAAGNKDSLVQRLMIIAQIHEKALAGGLPIVQADDAYELAKALASAADLSGDKFFTDPRTVQPPPPPPDYNAMMIEVENKKADTDAQKVQVDAREDELDAEIKKYEADLRAELEKYKTDLNAELQIALAQMKEGTSVNLERVRARIKNAPADVDLDTINNATGAVNALQATIAELQSQINSPREVVRDDNGEVIGANINGEFRPVRRDENGRVIGV